MAGHWFPGCVFDSIRIVDDKIMSQPSETILRRNKDIFSPLFFSLQEMIPKQISEEWDY